MNSSPAGGFTLIEITTVLIIMGIIAVVVTAGLRDSTTSLAVETDVIKSRLKYTQSRAMNSNSIWGVKYDGNDYWLFKGNETNMVQFPGEEAAKINLNGKNISLGSFSAVSFDAWGRPFNNETGTGTTSGSAIIVSMGSMSKTITITSETGFIP